MEKAGWEETYHDPVEGCGIGYASEFERHQDSVGLATQRVKRVSETVDGQNFGVGSHGGRSQLPRQPEGEHKLCEALNLNKMKNAKLLRRDNVLLIAVDTCHAHRRISPLNLLVHSS